MREEEDGNELATGIIAGLEKAYPSQGRKRIEDGDANSDSGQRTRTSRHKYIDKTRSLKCCQVFGTLPRIQQDAHGETFTDNSEPGDDRTGHFRDETEAETGDRGAETEDERVQSRTRLPLRLGKVREVLSVALVPSSAADTMCVHVCLCIFWCIELQ